MMEMITKNCTRCLCLNVYFGQKSHFSSENKQQQQYQVFFRYGPPIKNFRFRGQTSRSRTQRNSWTRDQNQTRTIKNSLIIFPKHRTIISANRRENKLFLSELESFYERPVGIAGSPRFNFGLCSNPISKPPPFSTIFQWDQNRSSRSRNKIIVREKSNKCSKSRALRKISVSPLQCDGISRFNSKNNKNQTALPKKKKIKR